MAVISEDEMIPLCEKYGINFTKTENLPLGRKKNFGLKYARRFDFDFMMEIGSDTLILNELLDDYKTIDEKFFGVSDAAFIDMETGACRRWISKRTLFGGGRMISREILEQMDFTIWPEQQNRGLDNGSVYAISKRTKVPYRKTYPLEFPMVVDLKSKDNIWGFNAMQGNDYDVENILSRLSEKENNLINAKIGT